MTRTTSLYPFRLFLTALFVCCLGLLPLRTYAQQRASPELFSPAELAQMLAPIALYPDALLSQILMASTYPIEIVEADRWLGRRQGLTGDALDEALLGMDWDPSVKALGHFPSVLALMSERIGETTDLGNAFLAQETEVMAMVQKLRAEAYAQGQLASNAQQTVFVQDGAIIIAPLDPAVIYVPYYDPFYVYGPWWYPAYPPYYWGPARVSLGVGIHYWPGTFVSFSFGNWCSFDWPRRYLHIDLQRRPRFVRHAHWIVQSERWRHLPHHRRGVAYQDRETARRYGQAERHSDRSRRDFQRPPERGVHDRMTGRRGASPIGTVRDQRRLERPRPVIDRPERSYSEQLRQVHDRLLEVTRQPATLDTPRQVQTRPEGSRQLHERRGADQQNRASLSRDNREQRRVDTLRPIQERPRRDQRQPIVTSPPIGVRQAPARTSPAQQVHVRQDQPRGWSPPQRRNAAEHQQRQGLSGRFSNRANEDRKERIAGGRGPSGSSRRGGDDERRGRGADRGGRR